MQNVHFVKYVACGNDFIILDGRQKPFPFTQKTWIQQLCHRHYGVGADGVLFMEHSHQADCKMRIFNSDGSEAEMCGNGLRCFTHWLIKNQFYLPYYRIEVGNRIFLTSKTKEMISIEMKDLTSIQWDIAWNYHQQDYRLHSLDTGVPHAVLFIKEIDQFNFVDFAREVRHHSRWAPKGTNVTIAELMSFQKIKIRTFERGVEGETLACGTGAIAAAVTAARLYSFPSPISIQTRSGEELEITFSCQNGEYSPITLTGPVKEIFHGEFSLDAFSVA